MALIVVKPHHSLGSSQGDLLTPLDKSNVTRKKSVQKSATQAYCGITTSATTTNGVAGDGSSQDFVVGESQAKTIEFGAFRSQFLQNAESARKNAMVHAADLGDKKFSEAYPVWLEQKRIYNRESTINCYQDYLSRLNKFFGPIVLKDIHIGHIQEYQRIYRAAYHPASVNHDINTLSQILRKAGLWAAISEYYRPLPLPETDPPKVMSESEEERFFEFASKNPEWWLAYWVASLTNNSTASGKELRMLQLQAVDLDADPPYFRVPKNMKNPNRPRMIPLNERGAEIMRRILKRSSSLGSSRPEHYVFPLRIKRNLFDPTKPASESWLRYRWKLLVDAARRTCCTCSCDKDQCTCHTFKPILTFALKPHNLRHQSITKLLDGGVPIETVRQIAGHGVDSIVTRHYHHGRMEVMARALDAIDPDRKGPRPEFPQKRGKGVTA